MKMLKNVIVIEDFPEQSSINYNLYIIYAFKNTSPMFRLFYKREKIIGVLSETTG